MNYEHWEPEHMRALICSCFRECLLMNDLRGDHEKTNGEASNYNRGACAVSLFERRNDKKLPTEKVL